LANLALRHVLTPRTKAADQRLLAVRAACDSIGRCTRADFTLHRSSSGPGTTTNGPRGGRRSEAVRSWDHEERPGGMWILLSVWGCEVFLAAPHWRGCWTRNTEYQTPRTCRG